MRTIEKNEKLGVLLIAISALGYGLMPIFSIGPLSSGTAVSTLLFIRFTIAATILWLYIFAKKVPFKTSPKALLYLISIGLIGFTVASISIYHAYNFISGSVATLILFTHPFFVLILESVYNKTKVSHTKFVALAVILIGLIFVLYQKNVLLNIKGIIYAFISSIAYAIYCFGLSNKETQKLTGIAITAYVTTVTAVTTGIQCLINGDSLITNSSEALYSGIILALFSTLIASITFYEGLSIVGPSSATLISSFEPVVVVLMSALFLNEIIKFNVLLGGLIIILGILILEYKPKKKHSY